MRRPKNNISIFLGTLLSRNLLLVALREITSNFVTRFVSPLQMRLLFELQTLLMYTSINQDVNYEISVKARKKEKRGNLLCKDPVSANLRSYWNGKIYVRETGGQHKKITSLN